jgi:hypothetical protein
MPNQTLTLTIASQLQKAGFTEAAEHMRVLQKETEGVKKGNDAWADAIGKVKGALTVTAVLAFYKTAVDEASRAEQSQLKLKTSIESTGLSWDRVKEQVNGTTQALSALSRFSKGDLDESLNVLIQRTGDLGVAQANLQTVMGISVATGRDLNDVADQIGKAAAGSERDTMQLAKAFGITGKNAKDADFVLEELGRRFGDLATTEKTTQAELDKLKNTLMDIAEQVGTFVLPIFNAIVDGTRRFTLALKELVGSGLAALIGAITALVTGDMNLLKASWQELKDGASAAWKEMADENKPAQVKITGKKTIAAVKEINGELLQAIQDLNAETAKIQASMQADEALRLEAEIAAYKAATLAKYEHEIQTAEQRNALLAALDARAAAQRQAFQAKQYEEQFRAAVTFGSAIGAITGRMVAGEREAWKQITDVVIDSLVQQLQASIIAGQARAWITEVAGKGFLGLATGAVLSGLVAGVGEAAKAAIRGGAGSTPSVGGGGGGSFGGGDFGGGAAAEPAAAPRPESTVRVNIYGDMYGEPAFVDRLAMKISEAVENRDVRLVSTTTAGS